jgi:hypothetical protein
MWAFVIVLRRQKSYRPMRFYVVVLAVSAAAAAGVRHSSILFSCCDSGDARRPRPVYMSHRRDDEQRFVSWLRKTNHAEIVRPRQTFPFGTSTRIWSTNRRTPKKPRTCYRMCSSASRTPTTKNRVPAELGHTTGRRSAGSTLPARPRPHELA